MELFRLIRLVAWAEPDKGRITPIPLFSEECGVERVENSRLFKIALVFMRLAFWGLAYIGETGQNVINKSRAADQHETSLCAGDRFLFG
jgi:hypothetical protein